MYDIEEAFAAIEEELIASMIRNLERHSAWEEKEGFQWEQWQALQLQSLERYKKRNKKRFTKKFNSINQHIETAIREARERGGFEQELKILEAIKTGKFTSRGKKGANAEFFKINDRKIDALIKATVNDIQKAETAILRMANDKYRQVIFNAQVYANSGAGTYEKAVDMATKDFLSSGLNCVEYKNGARHTLKDYADMALRTASKRAYLTGEGEKRAEWGIHTVIVNKRGNPCPKCLPFVGRVFIDDVWSGGSAKDGKYPLLSSAVEAGLYHPRCKDSHTTFFPGITAKPVTYNKAELKQLEDRYTNEQKRKIAVNNVSKYRRLAKYSLDPENKSVYKRKAAYYGLDKAKNFDDFQQKYLMAVNPDNEVNDADVKAVFDYMSPKSYVVNDKLRRNEELTQEEVRFTMNLDKALDKMPSYSGTLQRSLQFTNDYQLQEFLKDYTIGNSIFYREYISTTKGDVYNADGQVQIFIQNSKNGKDISKFNGAEHEVLYKRNSAFIVRNRIERDGVYYILLVEKNE